MTTNRSFPIVTTIVTFAAIVTMAGLGFWQLDRKAQKEQRLIQIDSAKGQSALPLSKVKNSVEEYQDFVVSASGVLINKPFYIDNKLIDGVAGYHVIYPFETNFGTVMVNHGWIKGTGNRTQIPTVPFNDRKNIEGVVYIPANNGLISETNKDYGSFPAVLQQVDLIEVEKHLDRQVLPFIIRLHPTEESLYQRNWQVITMSPEKHLGYAIQWFGLAVAALTIYLLSVLGWMKAPNPVNNNKGD